MKKTHPRKSKNKKKTIFLKEMLKEHTVGAVTRSSKYIVQRILKNLDFENEKIFIVEYGPGDGVITKEILDKIGKEGKVIAVESNNSFIEVLGKIKDPRLEVRHQDVKEFLEKNNSLKADFVVSGIPFSFIKPKEREQIVKKTLNLLRENGKLIIYQNSLLMLPLLKKNFSSVSFYFEPRNFLPYFIMTAKKNQQAVDQSEKI